MPQTLYAAAENAKDCQQIVKPRKASDILICIGDNLCLACIYKDATIQSPQIIIAAPARRL